MILKFLGRLYEEMNDIRFAASSLAFSTLLSIIPFMVIVLAVFQYVGGLDELYPKMEGVLLNYMKEATGPTVTRFISRSLQTIKPATLGISGGLLLMFASLGLIRNMDLAFNKIWKVKINKPVYKRMWLHWMLLLAAPLTLAIFTGLKSTSFFSQVPQNLDHQFLFLFCICLLLFALYKIMPDVKVKTVPALLSASLAGILLALVQSSFLWFSVKVFKNNAIYGSLASFPIFLLWLLTVWYVVLTGVAFCAFLQQKVFK